MVFRHLTRALLAHRGEFRYRLYTHVSDPTGLDELRTALDCRGRDDVEIVSLPAGKNRFLWNALVLPWELFTRPIALYHTQYIAPFYLPQRTKLVTHIHDISFAVHPEWITFSDRFFLGLLIPRSLRRAAALITPSQFTKSELERVFASAQGKVTVVPNAVGTEWLAPIAPETINQVRVAYHLPERYIVASGTMQPRKNIPLLIQAWRERPAALQAVGLVLTGNLRGHNVDRSIDPAVLSEIVFPGYVETEILRGIVAGATVLAFPSLYEGFGLPILEAFASDTAVWAARIPAFIEVGGDVLVTFDPTNLAEAKETLYSLLVDDSERERLARSGRERLSLFRWSESSARLLDVYRAVLQQPV